MTTRHQTPDLRDANGNRILPRTLLQESIITTATGDVVLDLPATPWKRFEVEIEDWAPTSDLVTPLFQLGVNGGIRAGASDYQFHVRGYPSNTGTIPFDFDEAHTSVWMMVDAGTQRAGNGSDEALDYKVTISPGADANTLPKIWFEGSGINDANRLQGNLGFGVYRGVTSLEYGRADQIRFAFNSNTIARGTFRLYGTE